MSAKKFQSRPQIQGVESSFGFEIMLKKSAIVGLVLLATGSAALKWVITQKRKERQQITSYSFACDSEANKYLKQYYQWSQLPPEVQALVTSRLNNSEKTEAQLKQQQQERLKADLSKLAAGELQIYPFADVLYGENWRSELKKYKKRKELTESIFTGSIACTFTGGAVFSWCLLLWTVRRLIRITSRWKRLQSFFAVVDRPLTTIFTGVSRNGGAKSSQIEKYSAALINSGWQSPVLIRGGSNLKADEMDLPLRGKSHPNKKDGKHRKNHWDICPAKTAGRVEALLTDKNPAESTRPLKTLRENLNVNTRQQRLSQSTQAASLSKSPHNTLKLEHSLKIQAENLEKQITEFRQMAQSVQQTTLEHSKPLNSAIKELTQQVSAIREYAAHQQDRIEKLQDGYDWNIIRTFCLRVIRCIDNLESRIRRLSKEGSETQDLEEVRDELLFALESSGIERFEPEVNSDYRGQEKLAEAVKDQQRCNRPEQAGKIAKVIRSGYQYFINDDNVKVVRTAKVKLYG